MDGVKRKILFDSDERRAPQLTMVLYYCILVHRYVSVLYQSAAFQAQPANRGSQSQVASVSFVAQRHQSYRI